MSYNFAKSSVMFKFKYKVHIKKDLSFIVLTFIFATVPSLSEIFGLSDLVLALMPFNIELALFVPYIEA